MRFPWDHDAALLTDDRSDPRLANGSASATRAEPAPRRFTTPVGDTRPGTREGAPMLTHATTLVRSGAASAVARDRG